MNARQPPAPPLLQEGKEGEWLAWGVAQQPSRKNEDRFVVCHAPWADFVAAVLDGHNGKLAAETCSKRMVPLITEELAKLELSKPSPQPDDGEASSANWHPQVRCGLRENCGVRGFRTSLPRPQLFGPWPPRFQPACPPGPCAAPPPPHCRFLCIESIGDGLNAPPRARAPSGAPLGACLNLMPGPSRSWRVLSPPPSKD